MILKRATACLIFFYSLCTLADVCVQNADDFTKKEAELPTILQKLPIMFTAEKQSVLFYDVSAAIKILKDSAGRLKLQGYILKDDDLEVDENLITRACYDGDEMKITFASGSTYDVVVKKESVRIKGLNLQRSPSDRSYNAVVSRITKGASGNSDASSSNNNGKTGVR